MFSGQDILMAESFFSAHVAFKISEGQEYVQGPKAASELRFCRFVNLQEYLLETIEFVTLRCNFRIQFNLGITLLGAAIVSCSDADLIEALKQSNLSSRGGTGRREVFGSRQCML